MLATLSERRAQMRDIEVEFILGLSSLVSYHVLLILIGDESIVSISFLTFAAGAHTLTILSSDALTKISGYLGFQETQLTHLEWPCNMATGFSL